MFASLKRRKAGDLALHASHARYSKHYKIEEDDLTWLTTRVQTLRDTVDAICNEWLAALREVEKSG